jgi:hypothetical protein
MVILMFGLKFQGPHGFVFLEGLALGLYGLVASVLEVLILLIYKKHLLHDNKFVEFVDEFIWQLHMILLAVTHGIAYKFF